MRQRAVNEVIEKGQENKSEFVESDDEVGETDGDISFYLSPVKEDEGCTINSNKVVITVVQTPPRTRQYRQSKQKSRKSFQINNFLYKVEETQRARILTNVLDSLTSKCKDSILNVSNEGSVFEGRVHESLITYFKKLKNDQIFSIMYKQLTDIFGKELGDESFLKWLAKRLDIPMVQIQQLRAGNNSRYTYVINDFFVSVM